MTSIADALIVGGGPAGAAAAIDLARRGRSVKLIEQSTSPHHKVCGDFLSREAVEYIGRLGIDPHQLGAMPILEVRLAAQREITSCELPFPALSLTRRSLDEALISAAVKSGAEVLRGHRVDSLQPSAHGYTATLSHGASFHGCAALLASGKHDVSGHRRLAGLQNDLVAFKMYFRVAPAQLQALQGFVEIHLFPGGYAGLQLVEDHCANLCLLVTRTTLRRCGNNWDVLLRHMRNSCELLAQRLDSAEPMLRKPLALSSIPYGMLRTNAPANLWPLGDQAVVIPSFAGDGVSIALHSAHLAANFLDHGKASSEFICQLHRELRFSTSLATTLSRLMIAAPALAQAARVWPPLLGLIAARTRIPDYAWQSSHLQ